MMIEYIINGESNELTKSLMQTPPAKESDFFKESFTIKGYQSPFERGDYGVCNCNNEEANK